MHAISPMRAAAGVLLAALSLALAGCLITPGKFTSELALTGGDNFTFTYDGEIFFLGLSKLAQMGASSGETFRPETCVDSETYATRECTAAELDQQRKAWDEAAPARAAERKKQAEQMATVMGGINPDDPKAAEDLTRLLLRHKGWEQVESLGDGLFRVRYRISGTLGHDFLFPVIEGFPATNPFVQTIARKNGQLRINAPGFAVQGADNPIAGMMGGMGALAGIGAMAADEVSDGKAMPAMPRLEGTFTIRTTGTMQVRANNTDDGPAPTTSGEVLTWQITPRTTQMPTALIELAR
ncbi:MAG: hypothetical protein MUF47_03835 [Porphyrobacter sp.]|jgi:hypothetical protein|nr:hypothetical protein [Porphyrobacter sp.]